MIQYKHLVIGENTTAAQLIEQLQTMPSDATFPVLFAALTKNISAEHDRGGMYATAPFNLAAPTPQA